MAERTITAEQSRPAARRHRLLLLWIIGIVLGVAALLIGVWLLLFITKGWFVRPWFERVASSRLHRQVKVAGDFNFYFDPLDLALRADGLSVNARHVALRIRPFFLFGGRIVEAEIDGAHVSLQWDERVGVGGALGALVSPLALLVAFVDPGNGKAAACGPVLAGARATAQHTRSGKAVKGLGGR